MDALSVWIQAIASTALYLLPVVLPVVHLQ